MSNTGNFRVQYRRIVRGIATDDWNLIGSFPFDAPHSETHEFSVLAEAFDYADYIQLAWSNPKSNISYQTRIVRHTVIDEEIVDRTGLSRVRVSGI